MTTPTDHLPDGLKPREPNPQPKVAEQLTAVVTSLNATVNLVNRLEAITKESLAVSDDLLDWLMANKERLSMTPGVMQQLLSFSNRLLLVRERELAAYEDMLQVLEEQAPKMKAEGE